MGGSSGGGRERYKIKGRRSQFPPSDEGKLPLAAPALDLTFPAGGCVFVLMLFGIKKLGAVLFHPTVQIGGDAGVKLSFPVANVHVPHADTPQQKGSTLVD